ncbi:MAG: hypothetical protein HY781_11235, partial [Chloroflexi bacterium]|nr:hypothetical protein [Chloroflexota bacterium]
YEFGDAAWRFRFMMTEETGWGLSWNSARPADFVGITTGGTYYGIIFSTNRHIVVTRRILDTSYQRVFPEGSGKGNLTDKVLILETNIWHYMEISTFQGRFQIWLDGENIVDVQDDVPLPPGGFSIGKGDSGIMYFDAISVCGLSAPLLSIPVPVPVMP